jgi:hypothetical protein
MGFRPPAAKPPQSAFRLRRRMKITTPNRTANAPQISRMMLESMK